MIPGPDGLTPEQQQALQDQMLLVIQQIAQAIVPFVPAMSPEQLTQLAVGALEEQTQIQQDIYPTLLLDHPQLRTYPTLQVLIQGPNGIEGSVAAPKRLDNVSDPAPGIQWAFMMALLLSPSVRAVLLAHGFTYRFVQTKQDVSRPTGIIVKH